MCLYIDRERHPDGKPLVAGYDMLVWKWVCAANDEYALSPYRLTRWHYGAEQSAHMLPEPCEDNGIGPGLHAYYPDRSGSEVFLPSIIPRGAKFYFGYFREIVAERMTVYRTLDDALQGRTLGEADFSKHTAAP